MKRIYLILIAFMISGNCWGVEYLLDPSDPDPNLRSFTAAFAAYTEVPGDIFDGQDFTYYEQVIIPTSGTSGNLITIQNATIDGESTRQNAIRIIDKSYILVSNINGLNCTGQAFWLHGIDNVILDYCNGYSSFSCLQVEDVVSGLLTISNSDFYDCNTEFSRTAYINNSTFANGSLISNTKFRDGANNTPALVVRDSSNIDFINTECSDAQHIGFFIEGDSFDINIEDSIANGNKQDGFSIAIEGANSPHDITYNACKAFDNGNNDASAFGDGFTAHDDSYNLEYTYCLSYNNDNTAFAMIGRSHGWIYNCDGYGNGNATGPSVRGGIFIQTTDNNPTTAGSWTVRNYIGKDNYPREVSLSTASALLIDFDYADYDPINDSLFATLDGGTTDISWATYSSRESNSQNADPLFVNAAASDFHLTADSPAINRAAIIPGVTDQGDILGFPYQGDNPDIGAYNYYVTPQVSHGSGNSNVFRSVFGYVTPGELPYGCEYVLDEFGAITLGVNNEPIIICE